MSNGKVNLLVVDDDVALRTSLSQIFRSLGHRVRCAEDGFSALVEVRREQPQVILSDLHMPNMSGFLLLSILRQTFPGIRVIAMSSTFATFEDVPPGVIADAFYQKGSDLSVLLQIMATMTNMEQPPTRKTAPSPAPFLGSAASENPRA